MSSSKYRRFFSSPFATVALIVLIGSVVYGNSLHGPFLFDDVRTIVENDKIRDVSNYVGFDRIFQKRPFADLTFALNFRFSELEPFGYHLVNILIHLLNGVLVYFLGSAIITQISGSDGGKLFFFGPRPGRMKRTVSSPEDQFHDAKQQIAFIALFAALIFVTHPVQTQAVSYICQRYASLAALFYLLSVLFYLKGRMLHRSRSGNEAEKKGLGQADEKPYRPIGSAPILCFYILCIVSGLLAFLSKQTAASLPLAILLVEFFCIDATWAGWRKKIPWIGLTILVGTIGVLFYSAGGLETLRSFGELVEDVSRATRDTENVGRWSYLCTQFSVLINYIRLLFFPIRQNADPEFPFVTGFFDGWTPLWFLFLAGILFFAVRFRKKVPVISFGIFWFFITLSVESSIIPIRDAMYEHRLYLPIFGFSIAVSYAFFGFLQKRRSVALSAACAIIMLLGTAAHHRNDVWQSSAVLWADVLSKSPWNGRAHTNLGIALSRQGKLREAVQHFNGALESNPGDVQTLMNLGNTLALMGEYSRAVLIFSKLIAHEPDNAKAHFNMGTALAHQGSVAEAEGNFRKAVECSPGFIDARINLGIALMRQAKMDEAIDCFKTVLEANPNQKDAHAYLGLLFAKQGRLRDAEKELAAAIHVDPNDARARTNLGSVLAIQGRIDEAMDQFQKVLEIKPDSKQALKNLAILMQKKAKMRKGPLRNSGNIN